MTRSSRSTHILLALSLLFVDVSARTAEDAPPRLGDRPISIELSGPFTPWLTLAPGRALPDSSESAEGSALPLSEGAGSLALRTGDINEDGVPDLIHLLAVGASAVVETRLGRAAAIFPFSLRVARQTGAHDEEGLPFAQPQNRIKLSVRPAFFVVADVTLDGHLDLLFASAGSDHLLRRDGDGEGGFAPPVMHRLPGRITLLETGDMDRGDGVIDLLIGVEAPQQSLLLLEHGSHRPFLQRPEMIELPHSGSAAAAGRLDGDHLADLVVAFGESWGLVRGTSPSRGKGETRVLDLVRTGDAEIAALAIGNFVGGSGNDLLLLTRAGRLEAFERVGDTLVSTSSRSLAPHSGARSVGSGGWRMQRARVSSFEHDDLILSRAGTAGIEIFAQLDSDSGDRRRPTSGPSPVRTSLVARASVVDVVPMHLNRDARHDLVFLEESGGLSIVQTQQAGGYTVNATSTEPDGNPGDEKCAIEPCEDGNCTGPCTLPAALLEAALHLGEDSITFNLPAGSTIEGVNVGATQPIVVDGNIGGSPGIILGGGVAGAEGIDGVFLDVSDSMITGLVIHGWVQSFSAGGRGVQILGGTGNHIVGNYIGTDLTGNVPVDQAEIFQKEAGIQVAGDQTTISLNVIGGHQGGMILNSDGNEVTKNNVGVGKDGKTILFSSGGGIRVTGNNNRIGMNTNDGNLVSGNRKGFGGGAGIGVAAGKGNKIQGNVIGLAADQTLLPNGFAIVDEGVETVIGGPLGSQFNIIGEQVLLTGTGTEAMGNRLGTNVAGDESLGGMAGFDIRGSGHRIGGGFSEEGNIIAGGRSHGIRVSDAFDVEISNNFIGTGRNGRPALGSVPDAILVDSSQKIVVGENTIANSSGPGASGIAILGQSQVELIENQIFDNAGLGIDWGADGITENDTSEDVPNHPILESFEGGILSGRLDAGSGKFRVEVFSNSACDEPAVDSEGRPHGEGRDHVQSFSGLQSGPLVLSISAFVTGAITATATDETGSTSEFSNCIVASSAPVFLVNSTIDRREPEEKRGDGVCDTGEKTEGGLVECTLRAALEEANIDPDRNAIRFRDGLGTIEMAAGAPPLPPIMHPLRAPEGTFQEIFAGLPAASQSRVGFGLRVDGEGTVIEGLEIRHFQTGISILGQAELRGNRLLQNEFGLLVDLGNSTAPAVIGGPSTSTSCESPCNLISENTVRGIELRVRPAVVQGNWIGLKQDGGRAPGQEVGILARGAPSPEDVLIGGAGEGQGNQSVKENHLVTDDSTVFGKRAVFEDLVIGTVFETGHKEDALTGQVRIPVVVVVAAIKDDNGAGGKLQTASHGDVGRGCLGDVGKDGKVTVVVQE